MTHSRCKCRVVFLNDPNEEQSPIVVHCEWHKELEQEVEQLRKDRDVQRAWAEDYKAQRDELTTEVERLRGERNDIRDRNVGLRQKLAWNEAEVKRLDEVRLGYFEQVTNCEAEIERLREVLERIAEWGQPNSVNPIKTIARQALGYDGTS